MLNRTTSKAKASVEMIGAGFPTTNFSELKPADVVMISASDDAIADCCQKLYESSTINPDTIVFHCSGFLSSQILKQGNGSDPEIGSFHPVKSFTEFDNDVATFEDTPCGIEGSKVATDFLFQLANESGGIPFLINPEIKSFYHIGSVFVSNYLVTVLELGIRCYERAGIAREDALKLVHSLAEHTLMNVVDKGTSEALTGPIARGDSELIEKHLQALEQGDETARMIYKLLGQIAAELAQKKGAANPERLLNILEMLRNEKEEL